MDITSYEQFCQSCKEGQSQGLNLLYLQHMATRLTELEEDSIFRLSTDLFKEAQVLQVEGLKKDLFSEILEKTEESILYLLDSHRHKILREHVLLPAEKVRELDSYSINWLSRRPGNTPRQKMANSRTIMAVKRRSSCNTAENQLFLAFLNRVLETMEQQETGLSAFRQESFIRLQQSILSHLQEEEWEEVERWRNLPPNNTLLSDRYYRVIWSGWNDLEDLDESIQFLDQNCESFLILLLKMSILVALQKICFVPQSPIYLDREKFTLITASPLGFYAMDWTGEVVMLTQKENVLQLSFLEKEYQIQLYQEKLQITRDGVTLLPPQEFEVDRMEQYQESILKILDISHCPPTEPVKSAIKVKFVVIDLFSLYSQYFTSEREQGRLDGRLLVQSFRNEGEMKQYVSCYSSSSILYFDENIEHNTRFTTEIDTFTFTKGVLQQDVEALKHLTALLNSKVMAEYFTFLSPDYYNEFQLKQLKETLKLSYRHVESFPKSIALAFFHERNMEKNRVVNLKTSYLLVLDLVGHDLTFTLIKGVQDEEMLKSYPQNKGLVWERHPCYQKTHSFSRWKDLLQENFAPNSEDLLDTFGLEGLIAEEEKLLFISDQEASFLVSTEIKDELSSNPHKMDVLVGQFLESRKSMIATEAVTVITSNPFLHFDGTEELPFFRYQSEDEIVGFSIYKEMQKETKLPLWRDNLPRLAIKTMDTSVDLVKSQKIIPIFGEVTEIFIDQTITLTKGKMKYRFQVVKDDSGSEVEYQAVVENSGFPLAKAVECKLKMQYTYGAEEPYELYFLPLSQSEISVRELRVRWSLETEYDWDNLEYPSFPKGQSMQELLAPSEMGSSQMEGYCRQFHLLYVSLLNSKKVLQGDRQTEKAITVETEEYGVVDCSLNKGIVNLLENNTMFYFNVKEYLLETTEEISLLDRWKEMIGQDGPYFACWERKMGYSEDIAFFDYNFHDLSEFHTGIKDICFKPVTAKNGKLTAKNICPKASRNKKRYKLTDIKTEKHYAGVRSFLISVTFRTFFNGRNLSHPDFPEGLRQAVTVQLNPMIETYLNPDSTMDKILLFRILSLLHMDVKERYYPIALERVESYSNQECKLPDEIGVALGELCLPEQRELLVALSRLKPKKFICILSKAIWCNENFVFNLQREEFLEYIAKAVDNLESMVNYRENNTDILLHLEFLLGAFRLRECGEDEIQKKLSLQDVTMQKLQKIIKQMQKKKLDIQLSWLAKKDSRIELKVNATNKTGKEYGFIDIFMMYLQGSTEGCDIIIQTNDETYES